MTKSLHGIQHELSDTERQRQILDGGRFEEGELPTFEQKLEETGHETFKPTGVEIFQVNVGYMCNMTCKHCHVDAGPDRKEIMTRENIDRCLDIMRETDIQTLDLTGGAPEMNPDFRYFVREAKKAGVREIIVRSNLTILLAPKYKDLPEFFREHSVRVVSSLPFYEATRTDRQRGDGTFSKSIEALQRLNEIGYGQPDSDLILDLVYNPGGAFLPPDQEELENEFKDRLLDRFGIRFNSLFCITNLPISRFLDYLLKSGNYEDYMEKLVHSFNPAAVPGVMCRNTISVGWDGYLYDCDFNQMLDMTIQPEYGEHIRDFDLQKLNNRPIQIGQHCFGCTAGAGSSCQGTVA